MIVHCTYLGVSGFICFFKTGLLPEDLSYIKNSVDPNEMPHFVAFHLGLHCL